MFHTAVIPDCTLTEFKHFKDDRGWLAEIFRKDELPNEQFPTMGYLSLTLPNVARGPHEHHAQTDLFVFFDGTFRVYLWDMRPNSPTYLTHQTEILGKARPATLIVPPGVVHAYKNIGEAEGLIFNCPNQLYAGWQKKEPIDEIRHEEHAESLFKLY